MYAARGYAAAMLRPIILALSRSRVVEHVATNVPGFRGFSARFVAGQTQADVLEAVRRPNAVGFEKMAGLFREHHANNQGIHFFNGRLEDFPADKLVVPQPVVFNASDGAEVHGQLFRAANRIQQAGGKIVVVNY